MKTNNPVPQWIEKLVKTAADSIRPLNAMGPLGWCWSEPQTSDGKWEVTIYPTPSEIYGGPGDGIKVFPGYNMVMNKLLGVFDNTPSLSWSIRGDRQDKFIGPELLVEGNVARKAVAVRLFVLPPFDEKAVIMIDPARNLVWNKNGGPPGEITGRYNQGNNIFRTDEDED